MSVNSKHIATFLLGAAAALAVTKYMNMTDEEKDKLSQDIKDKANSFRDDAESAVQKAKEYFEELKQKGSSVLKDNLADVEKTINDLFEKKPTA